MGQELQRHTPVASARQADPPWLTVAGTTLRLWFERHRPPAPRRPRLAAVLSALAAMALGAGVTLAFTGRGSQPAAQRRLRPGDVRPSWPGRWTRACS